MLVTLSLFMSEWANIDTSRSMYRYGGCNYSQGEISTCVINLDINVFMTAAISSLLQCRDSSGVWVELV